MGSVEVVVRPLVVAPALAMALALERVLAWVSVRSLAVMRRRSSRGTGLSP